MLCNTLSFLFIKLPRYWSQDPRITKLPFLNIRPQIQLIRKRRPRLRMQKPIRIGNLHRQHTFITSWGGRSRLTASGLSFASSCSKTYPFVRGISITPSTMTCATCTPLGPNSLAKDCERALRPNFALAKAPKRAEPRTLAVAPVYCQYLSPYQVGVWGEICTGKY